MSDASRFAPVIKLIKFIGLILLCLAAAAVGGAISRHWGGSTYTISYSDFISILLTAISTLMAVLAIFLAVLGVVGWGTIESRAKEKMDAMELKSQQKIDEMETRFRGEHEKFMSDLNIRAEEALRTAAPGIAYEGVESLRQDLEHDASELREAD